MTGKKNDKQMKDDSDLKHIIFVPGFYGSRLIKKESKEVVWLTAYRSFFGTDSIALDGFDIAGSSQLVEGGVFDKVTIIPGLLSRDVYAEAIEFLKGGISKDIKVHILSYDWRKDYYLAVQKLAQKVEELKKSGASDINLVAHSLGGLVSSYYLRYGDQDPRTAKENWFGASQFNKVFLATIPYRGCLLSFRNKFKGVNWISNEDLINADVLSSFVTNYQMLPMTNDSFLDNDLKPISFDLMPSGQWMDNKWGFLKSASGKILEKRFDFVKDSLDKTKRMNELLNQPLQSKASLNTELVYYKGVGRKTMTKGILYKVGDKIYPVFDEEDIKKYMDSSAYEKLFTKGDETLSEVTAELPQAYKDAFKGKIEVHNVNTIHSKVYNHKEVRKRLKLYFK